jgi:hypothetical protein
MNLSSAARFAGAALAFGPAMLAAQTTKTVTLGGDQFALTSQSLVSAAGDVNADSRYQTPVSPAYNGVASLQISTTAGLFICTGSLLNDGQTVLTAAHCLKGSIGTVTGIKVNFFPTVGGAVEQIAATSWAANPNYSTHVIDENDVGVIHLASTPSANVTRYKLYDGSLGSTVNSNFQFVGYGQRGSFGTGTGTAGNGAGFGLSFRRTGYNLFDVTLGDSRWNGFWNDPNAAVGHVLLADFDNGTTGINSNDGMCWIGRFTGSFGFGSSECNAGRGLDEAIVGGGDSGGPGFINGMIASITSFGTTFGSYQNSGFPDPGFILNSDGSKNYLNSSFGEFAGFVDADYQSDWIESQMAAPEPTTTVLMATGLIGIAGFARRRRKNA